MAILFYTEEFGHRRRLHIDVVISDMTVVNEANAVST